MSVFSTWEKELHKIVFDPRYLLLTSKERKQVFEQYVKERAEEERREKRNKLKEKKEQFRQLLEEAHLTSKLVYFHRQFFQTEQHGLLMHMTYARLLCSGFMFSC